MGLAKYHAKRKFEKTPEPKGEVKKGAGQKAASALRFVVQKHHASHLHYDFRLELDGVLKSWAIPKGPSLNPADKRLAMAVEDHPYDYRTFEGVIPKGNYGAGNVIVWDEGTFTIEGYETQSRAANEKAFRKALDDGTVKLVMTGHKLNGIFTLVRSTRQDADSEKVSWLLIKHRDDYVTEADICKQDRSVLSGRSLDDIAAGKPALAEQPQLLQAPKKALPKDPKPMLATLVDEAFDRDGWIFEIKWDGYRAVTSVTDGDIHMVSRNGTVFNTQFATVAQSLAALPGTAILDGEVVALDDDGKPSFGMLQDSAKYQNRLCYYVFDLLYLDGRDLRDLPLIDRKALLKTYLATDIPNVRYCDHIETKGLEFFKLACEEGLEGIIAKDGASAYRTGARSPSWLKIKSHQRQEAVICGYTEPRGSRKHIGAVILGMYETDGTLTYVGHTGTGFDGAKLDSIKTKLDAVSQEKSPFKSKVKTNAPVHWVTPKLVCEVKFQEWTGDGHLRQPVFMGLRQDKAAESVMRETTEHTEDAVKASKPAKNPKEAKNTVSTPEKKPAPKTQKNSTSKKGALAIFGKVQSLPKVKVTHRDKVFWPDSGLTKGDLVDYYQTVAPLILPYLKDRPINLHRFPNGVTGEGFYQKDHPNALPDFVETVSIYSESNDRELRYLLCQNVETLTYLANLGCIEMNPWNVCTQHLEKPDYVVIDLDPLDIGFDQVINTALAVKTVLDKAGIPGYCKTSGATGLHIFVPLAARYPDETVKNFANLLAVLIHQEYPDYTSIERSPAKRKGKVYLDYLQNRFGQTLASVYSARPTAFAGVSTPLHWEEVAPGLTPESFTLKTILNRLESEGDLWTPVLGKGISLDKAIRALE